LLGMEACSGAHYIGRQLAALGHDVRLIPAQYVKPFLQPGLLQRPASGRRRRLVLLSIAIMALLLTDADAKRRRSSAQGSQAAGASRSWCATYGRKGINDNCSYATQQQCLAQVWGLGGFCRPNPFPGTAYGTGYTWSSGPPR
jgi:hypothetical protein